MLGRLAAKHTFIICNLPFRGAEEEKRNKWREEPGRLRQRNQTLCEIEAGLSHSKHERTSNHMWHLCYLPITDSRLKCNT